MVGAAVVALIVEADVGALVGAGVAGLFVVRTGVGAFVDTPRAGVDVLVVRAGVGAFVVGTGVVGTGVVGAAVVGAAVIGTGVVGTGVVGTGVVGTGVVGTGVVGTGVVGTGVVGTGVVGTGVVGTGVVGMGVVGTGVVGTGVVGTSVVGAGVVGTAVVGGEVVGSTWVTVVALDTVPLLLVAVQVYATDMSPGCTMMRRLPFWAGWDKKRKVLRTSKSYDCNWTGIVILTQQQSIIPKKTQQTDLMFSHNPIFALFSSVAIQREKWKNQEQGNIYKDLSVRSCAESVCAQCACVKCSCDF